MNIKFALFFESDPLTVPVNVAALLDELLTSAGGMSSGVVPAEGEPCLRGNVLHVNMKLQSDLTKKCLLLLNLALCVELGHQLATSVTAEVAVMDGVLTAALCAAPEGLSP